MSLSVTAQFPAPVFLATLFPTPGQNLIVLPIVLPLLAAFLMQPLAKVSGILAKLLGPLVLALSALLLVLIGLHHGSAPFSIAVGGYAPPLGIVFYVDRLALLFATLVPAMALLFWSRGEDEPDSARRDAVMLLMSASATGLALSGDLFNIYVFYELTAVASFGLITLQRTGRGYIAMLRYLLISAVGSLFALIGIATLYTQVGTLNLAQIAQLAPTHLQGPAGLAAFALLVLGLGVKAELFPLNTWAPEVYATAPARISAILAGLISKLAVIVIVRLLVMAYADTGAAELLLALGLLGLLSAELAAWHARDFSRMLAYSSVGQLGLVFIAFALPGPAGILAGLAVALQHLVVKSALFGLAARLGGSLERLSGLARSSPLTAGLLALFTLSLIGVPPLPGFWAKLMVVVGLTELGTPVATSALIAILVATAVEASYLMRLLTKVYQAPHSDGAPPVAPARIDIAVAAVCGALLIAATLAIEPLAAHLGGIAAQAADVQGAIATVYPEQMLQPE